MKKYKEALFYIIPFIVLTFFMFVPFLLNSGEGFTSGTFYLKLLFSDKSFWAALLNTLGTEFLFAFIAIVILNVIKIKKNLKGFRDFFDHYLLDVVLGTVISIIVFMFFKDAWLFMPEASRLIWIYTLIFAVQIGNVASFIVWLFKLVKGAKKTQEPTEK